MSISSITGNNPYLMHGIARAEKLQDSNQSQTVSPDQQKQSQSYGNSSASQASKVSLSVDALFTISKVNQANSVVPSKYEQFFPTRDGFSAHNLASAIEDPSAQPFSRNRPLAEVAQAARANLDDKYQQMIDSGKPFNDNSFEGVDHQSLFGEFDRRALHAVASNEGGIFSENEQSTAKMYMSQQQALAMGLYRGPSRLESNFVQPLPGMRDHAEIAKASILFLDKVSNDEKSSIAWAHSRAVSQSHYEMEMNDRGQVAEDFTSENPLVRLLMEAFDNWSSRPGLTSIGNVENEDDLRKQPWFVGFEDQLDAAILRAKELYGVGD